MDRCTKCCLPDRVPSISFDSEGVCNFCNSFRSSEALGEEALSKLTDEARGKSEYDCLVPLSGGRDSTFVLYFAKKVLGLKTLAIHYDNEFGVEQAKLNMKRSCEILDVPLITVRSKRDLAGKVVVNGIRTVLPEGLDIFAGDACRACEYGYRTAAFRIALEHKIPLIFWGDAKVEATQDMEKSAIDTLRATQAPVGRRLRRASMYKKELYALLHRMELRAPGVSFWSRRDTPKLNSPTTKEISLFDYVTWDRNVIKQAITNEAGWEIPKGAVSTWRTDCSLHIITNFCYFRWMGCTKDCLGYTKMINSGYMTREEALQQEEKMAVYVEESVPEVLAEVGLSTSEIDTIMKKTGNPDKNLHKTGTNT